MTLTTLIAQSKSSTPIHTFEFFPPRTPQGLQNLLDRIQRLSGGPLDPPLAISVTWGAGGSTAVRSLELAKEIVDLQLGGREGKVEVILHLTCTNMGKTTVDEALKKCKELGIQNILALRGDPPRKEEYRPAPGADHDPLSSSTGSLDLEDDEQEFEYAEDLVRYIAKEYEGWFCIGVAGYPTPHPDSSSAESDISFLTQKVKAGADFIITQLFYDVEGFLAWVGAVRAAGVDIPIIPGIMPIQNYASFRRLTNLCQCPVPAEIMNDLEPIKSDDAAVKRYGIRLATKMVSSIISSPLPSPFTSHTKNVPGVHFCTLNLEKSVRTVLEDLQWTISSTQTPSPTSPALRNRLIEPDADVSTGPVLGTSPSDGKRMLLSVSPGEAGKSADERFRRTSRSAGTSGNVDLGFEKPGPNQPTTGAATGISTTGGVEDSWDEYPNGRFTDVRSPAYGEIDGWGSGLKITPAQALRDWGTPVDASSLSTLFSAYLHSDPSTPTTPFCDLPISAESYLILPHLLALNAKEKRWWTVGSQPAVDGARSEDEVHGFGPKGGWVFQKSFVEFFVESEEVAKALVERVEKEGEGLLSIYAGNKKGDFLTNTDKDDVNAVTWAVFPGQEIVQSTIIEEISFNAWKEEAFEIWTEWSRLYPLHSASRKLLAGIASNSWLVSVIHHDYKDKDGLWRFLLDEKKATPAVVNGVVKKVKND